MDTAIQIIKALISVLGSENVQFNGLNQRGMGNFLGIIARAKAFVHAYETEQAQVNQELEEMAQQADDEEEDESV